MMSVLSDDDVLMILYGGAYSVSCKLSYNFIHPFTSLFNMKSTFVLATLACVTHSALSQPTHLRSNQPQLGSDITTRSEADSPVSLLLHGLLHIVVGEGKNGASLLTLNASF